MNKLPFVWELNNKGVISHIIGIPQADIKTTTYTPDIVHYLDGKKRVLFEDNRGKHNGIELVIEDIVTETGCAFTELQDIEENTYFWFKESLNSNDRMALLLAYTNGDEKSMREFCERHGRFVKTSLSPEEFSQHVKYAVQMFERSLLYLQQPCLATISMPFLLTRPSLLTFYKLKGIEVKRITELSNTHSPS